MDHYNTEVHGWGRFGIFIGILSYPFSVFLDLLPPPEHWVPAVVTTIITATTGFITLRVVAWISAKMGYAMTSISLHINSISKKKISFFRNPFNKKIKK